MWHIVKGLLKIWVYSIQPTFSVLHDIDYWYKTAVWLYMKILLWNQIMYYMKIVCLPKTLSIFHNILLSCVLHIILVQSIFLFTHILEWYLISILLYISLREFLLMQQIICSTICSAHSLEIHLDTPSGLSTSLIFISFIIFNTSCVFTLISAIFSWILSNIGFTNIVKYYLTYIQYFFQYITLYLKSWQS